MVMRQLYLSSALRAIEHVRAKLPLGASNDPENPRAKAARKALSASRADIGDLRVAMRPRGLDVGKAISKMAQAGGAGNCGEQAEIAFQYLKGLGVSPIELFCVDPSCGDHAFVVIGRPAAAETRWIDATWQDAVLCDPWENIAQAARADEDAYPNHLLRIKRWSRTNAMDF